MQADKSTIILEAQWMENEIPRIENELDALKKLEQELLTAPIESINQVYTETYNKVRKRAYPFYHRRRTVTPTRYGYKERMLDVGWFTILAQLIILAGVVWAGYIVYTNYQWSDMNKGVIWGAVVLVVAIGFAFVPAFGDELWERRARHKAESAAQEARQSKAFQVEKETRQRKLHQCRARMSELEERLKFSHLRYDELRRQLTIGNHKGATFDAGNRNSDPGLG
ncbi:MAG: hypothetical protein JW934_18015 [Anaerolineae bacterium]|nr:hypothetical protein [Anaerolineae bacterium]